jgi:phenylacetate-CoA ligase
MSPRTDEMKVIRGVKVHHRQIINLLEKTLGFVPNSYRFLICSEELRDFLEIWLKVDETIFSDEIKGMERLCLRLGKELTQELGLPVKIRLKEESSFQSLDLSPGIEDLRSKPPAE